MTEEPAVDASDWELARKIASELDVEHDDTWQESCRVCQRVIPLIASAITEARREGHAAAKALLDDERAHHASQMMTIGDARFRERNLILSSCRRWDEDPTTWDKDIEDRVFRQIRYLIEKHKELGRRDSHAAGRAEMREEAAQIIAIWFGEGHKLTNAIRALSDERPLTTPPDQTG